MDARVGWETVLAALLLGLVLSMLIAWVYETTYQGIGYLRGFTQTLSLAGLVAALVMLAIGDDIARGLGMVGALTLIRFRANLKDTRDLIFVFAALAAGIACGVLAFTVAVIGTAVFCAAAFYIWWSPFGSRRGFDAVVRFRLSASAQRQNEVTSILRHHCRELSLIHMRDAGGDAQECCYQIKLAKTNSESLLLEELGRLEGISATTLLRQDTSLEM